MFVPRDVLHKESTPRTTVDVNRTIVLKVLAELVYHLSLLRAIAWISTANRRDVVDIDMAGEAMDVLAKTSFGETVSVALYDGSDLISMFDRIKSPAHYKVELRLVDRWIECDRVRASGKWVDGFADGVTIIVED